MYAVLNKQKLEPEHVELGLALNQATRSEHLLDLLHAANHAIGIDTVRGIDKSIAQKHSLLVCGVGHNGELISAE